LQKYALAPFLNALVDVVPMCTFVSLSKKLKSKSTMKNIFLTAAFALGSLSFAFAQSTPATNPNAAEVAFEKEIVDYGKITKGANGEREFVFKNTGKEPLIINNCYGSCGCTVPEWPRTPIAPGAKASIKVKYDTQRLGAFTKTVTVQSNGKSATKVLTIKGDVADAAQPVTTPVNDKATGSKISK
jgi:hypothetical protein